MHWVAVDAMGGDFAPRLVVDGALAALAHADVGVTLELRFDRFRAADQRHAEIRLARRGQRAVNNEARREVAAHGVDGYPLHGKVGVQRSGFSVQGSGSWLVLVLA